MSSSLTDTGLDPFKEKRFEKLDVKLSFKKFISEAAKAQPKPPGEPRVADKIGKKDEAKADEGQRKIALFPGLFEKPKTDYSKSKSSK
jgi:hypothetical protein